MLCNRCWATKQKDGLNVCWLSAPHELFYSFLSIVENCKPENSIWKILLQTYLYLGLSAEDINMILKKGEAYVSLLCVLTAAISSNCRVQKYLQEPTLKFLPSSRIEVPTAATIALSQKHLWVWGKVTSLLIWSLWTGSCCLHLVNSWKHCFLLFAPPIWAAKFYFRLLTVPSLDIWKASKI